MHYSIIRLTIYVAAFASILANHLFGLLPFGGTVRCTRNIFTTKNTKIETQIL